MHAYSEEEAGAGDANVAAEGTSHPVQRPGVGGDPGGGDAGQARREQLDSHHHPRGRGLLRSGGQAQAETLTSGDRRGTIRAMATLHEALRAAGIPSLRALAARTSIDVGTLSKGRKRKDDGGRQLTERHLQTIAAELRRDVDEVRALFSPANGASSAAQRRYEAQWEHQLQHLRVSFSIEHSVTPRPRADGRGYDSHFRRHVRDCLPLAGHRIPNFVARDRAISVENLEGKGARPHVILEPNCPMDIHVAAEMGWRVAKFVFPQGWRREDGPLEFTLETVVEQGYATNAEMRHLDPVCDKLPLRAGSVGFCVRHAIDHLTILVDHSHMPEHERAGRWLTPWCWWDASRLNDVPDNLIDEGVCRSYNLTSTPTTARLDVEAPLAGYTFAVIWEAKP